MKTTYIDAMKIEIERLKKRTADIHADSLRMLKEIKEYINNKNNLIKLPEKWHND